MMYDVSQVVSYSGMMKGKGIFLGYSLHITLNIILRPIYLNLDLCLSNWFIKHDSKQFKAWIELYVVLADPCWMILEHNTTLSLSVEISEICPILCIWDMALDKGLGQGTSRGQTHQNGHPGRPLVLLPLQAGQWGDLPLALLHEVPVTEPGDLKWKIILECLLIWYFHFLFYFSWNFGTNSKESRALEYKYDIFLILKGKRKSSCHN